VTTPSRSRTIIATVVLGTVLNPLDGSMMAVAMPAIRDSFAATAASATWLITVYYLAGAVAQPIMGRIADLLGARRVFVGGLLLVAVACSLAQFAPTIEWLIGLRLVQAVGSSVAFPAGLIIVRRSLLSSPEASARAVGSITWINSLAAVAGPLVGGAMVQLLGWRGPFVFGIPFALLGASIAMVTLPRDADGERQSIVGNLWKRTDALGAVLLGTAIAALQLGIVGLASPWMLAWFGAFAIALVALIVREKRAAFPFLDAEVLFSDRKTPVVLTQYMLANFTFFAVIVSLPTWLQLAHSLQPVQSGLVTFPIAVIGVSITLLLSRFVYGGHGQRVLVGMACVSLGGAVALSFLTPATPLLAAALFAVAAASPNNLTTLTLQSSLYQRVDSAATGAATGLFQTFRYVGATLASTVVGLNLNSTDPALLTAGMRNVMLCAVVAGGLALVLALVLRPGAAPSTSTVVTPVES
jgi:predicted MFS family arabinose efflux permease